MADQRGLLANLGILSVGQVAAQLLNLAAFVYIARSVGEHDFGLIQIGVTVCAYALISSEWGLFSLGIRSVARLDDPRRVKAYAARHLGLIQVAAIIVILLGAVLMPLTNFGRTDPLLFILYLCAALPQAGMLDWLGIGLQQMRTVSQTRILRSIIYVSLIFGLLSRIDGVGGWPAYRWVPVLFIVSFFFGNLRIIGVSRGWLGGLVIPDLRFGRDHFEMLREARPIGLANLVRRILFTVDLLLLGILLSPASAGRYAAAAKLVFSMVVVMEIVLSVVLPPLSRWWREDRAQFRSALNRYLGLTLLILSPIAVGSLMTGRRIIAWLYNGAFSGAGEVLGIMAVSYVALSLAMLCHEALVASDQQRKGVLPLVIGAIIAVVLVSFAAPRWGLGGAAYSMIIAHGSYLLLVAWRCRDILDRTLRPWIIHTAAGVVTMGLVLRSVPQWHPIAALSLGVGVYAVTVFVAHRLLRPESGVPE